MMTLQQLQKEAHATAVSKGWHEKPICARPAWLGGTPSLPDHDRILAKHALIHSEISEAVECLYNEELLLHYIDDKPEGFVVEIADALIRILDTVGALGLHLDVSADWLERAPKMRPAMEISATPVDARRVHLAELWLSKVRGFVDGATEAVRADDWRRWCEQFAYAVQFLASICAGLNLDLSEALDAKMTYNKTRPHRHGGKRA